MQKYILATHNQGKVQEIQHRLQSLNISIVSMGEFNIESIPETGSTFVENAIIKARHAAKLSQLPAIADDSGLVIDALNGEPGIYSARYAGEDANNKRNIQKVLQQLEHVPKAERQGHFYCVMVLLRHEADPAPIICQGRWDGQILMEAQGEKGFGYDPIFYVPTHQCSAAELELTEKNKISHRGQALNLLIKTFLS